MTLHRWTPHIFDGPPREITAESVLQLADAIRVNVTDANPMRDTFYLPVARFPKRIRRRFKCWGCKMIPAKPRRSKSAHRAWRDKHP